MAINWVRIWHPGNDLYATVTERAFFDVWQHNGFVLDRPEPDLTEEADDEDPIE